VNQVVQSSLAVLGGTGSLVSAGVKPLIGVDAWIREPGERAAPSRIVFLCQNLLGYRRLTQLVTRSFLEGQQRGVPMLERSWMSRESLEGLIVLSGGFEGDIGRGLSRGRDDEALRCLDRWRALCGDRFYLEVQRTGRAGEQAYSEAVVQLARSQGAAALATNDVRFLTRADFEAHEARVCIHDGAQLADAPLQFRAVDSATVQSSDIRYGIAPNVQAHVDGHEIVKEIVVPGKLVNLVVR